MHHPELPRRILMTADTVGGVWHFALDLARGLGRYEIDVLLATMGPAPRPDQRAAAAALANVQLRESRFRLEWMDDPWDDVAAAGAWLLALAEEFQPDVVHLNGYAHASLDWTAPVLVTAHSCVLSWWQAVRHGDAPPAWDRYRAAVSAGLRAADRVVAPSRAMQVALDRHYDLSAPVEMIPNGCDPEAAWSEQREPMILGAGRWWDEAKNARTLIEAACGLAWPLWLAGAEREEAPPGPVENVHLLGRCPRDAMAGHDARAGIFASPARYEPFGLAVLEAALGGCALVLGDIPSLRENWDGAAVFVPPDDIAAWHATLADLIAKPARREALAGEARRRARLFPVRRMAAGYLAAYARCRAARPQVFA